MFLRKKNVKCQKRKSVVEKYCLLISREVVNILPRFWCDHMSVTSPGIVHPCSRHAQTVTWGEHSQFHVMFSADYTCTPWNVFFSTIFFCPIVISTGMNENKSSKFESEGRITGNSLLHHGLFFPFRWFFLMTI